MKQKLVKTKFFLKFVSLVTPIFAYVVLFSQHSRVQAYFGLKCENNFIVELDRLMFGEYAYTLMDSIQHWSLDVLSACMYLIHYPLPFLFLIYLLIYKNETNNTIKFLLAFGMVNCVGVILQYIVPTPPPWMFSNLGPEAKFKNFDSLFHIDLFRNIYSKSPLVCGAWPSLHTAWPSIILCLRPWFGKTFCLLHVLLIGFSAIYSGHHYFIDVLFGFVFSFTLTLLCSQIIDKYFDFDTEFKFLLGDNLSNNAFLKLITSRNSTKKRNKILIYSLVKTNSKDDENIQLV